MTDLAYPELLNDEVVWLRPWRDTDLACVEQASQDRGIPQGTTVPARYTREEGLAFIARQHGRLRTGQGVSLAIIDRHTDQAVGLVVLMLRPQQGVAGIGYWVVPAARRRRIASHAIPLMTTWGLSNFAVARIEAWVEPSNVVSQRVLVVCLRNSAVV